MKVAISAGVIFIGIAIIESVLLGVNLMTLLTSALITVFVLALYGYALRESEESSKPPVESLEQQLIPHLSRQLESSYQFSSAAIQHLTEKIIELQHCTDATINEMSQREPNREKVEQQLKKIRRLQQEIIVLAQFGDRLQQKLAGVMEGMEVIANELRHYDKDNPNWDESKVRDALLLIEQRTKSEDKKEPHQEGSVTYF
ncbi:hypothetical protein [Vibrio sonorensis]|uniref:hypothetical protein n=1 Tax=Vibrio sonorensis TaxID=1004316 RepID=UPI0008D995E5|nr:hypothetical protein [Vibrio sonorensis]